MIIISLNLLDLRFQLFGPSIHDAKPFMLPKFKSKKMYYRTEGTNIVIRIYALHFAQILVHKLVQLTMGCSLTRFLKRNHSLTNIRKTRYLKRKGWAIRLYTCQKTNPNNSKNIALRRKFNLKYKCGSEYYVINSYLVHSPGVSYL